MAEQELPRVSSLKEHFSDLPDPRSPINRLHVLVDVLVMCVCGVLSGADGPAGIAMWAKLHREWLEEHLELPFGVPSRDTFRRVLQRLEPRAFQSCFAAWLESLVGPSGPQFMAIDGKTVRRSHDGKHQLGALHMVSVWATEQRLTLGQIATAAKSNEITAIPLILDLVDVQGAVVTIDAMGCQKTIAGEIVTRGGDYVLPVKGNPGNLEVALQEFFDDHLEDDFARVKVSRCEAGECHHGRKEHRTCMCKSMCLAGWPVARNGPACAPWAW